MDHAPQRPARPGEPPEAARVGGRVGLLDGRHRRGGDPLRGLPDDGAGRLRREAGPGLRRRPERRADPRAHRRHQSPGRRLPVGEDGHQRPPRPGLLRHPGAPRRQVRGAARRDHRHAQLHPLRRLLLRGRFPGGGGARPVRGSRRGRGAARGAHRRPGHHRQLPRPLPDGLLAQPEPVRHPGGLAVWSQLWGIAGAVLAVPITSVMVIVFSEFAGTRPIAILLSKNGRP